MQCQVHKWTFPHTYRLPLYHCCMNFVWWLQQTGFKHYWLQWTCEISAFFGRMHPPNQKTKTYWTIIIFAYLEIIYRASSTCIYGTLVWLILYILEIYKDWLGVFITDYHWYYLLILNVKCNKNETDITYWLFCDYFMDLFAQEYGI